MANTAFKMVEYMDKLEESGFTAKQAKAQTSAMEEFMENHVATKDDLESVRTELKHEIDIFRTEIGLKLQIALRDMKLWALGTIGIVLASSATILYNISHLNT